MSILDKIEQIQNKPESARYKILIISVVLIMALIIGLWQTLPTRDHLTSIDVAGPFKLIWENAKTTVPFDAEDLKILLENLKSFIPSELKK